MLVKSGGKLIFLESHFAIIVASGRKQRLYETGCMEYGAIGAVRVSSKPASSATASQTSP
jgi:hypothetical protein